MKHAMRIQIRGTVIRNVRPFRRKSCRRYYTTVAVDRVKKRPIKGNWTYFSNSKFFELRMNEDVYRQVAALSKGDDVLVTGDDINGELSMAGDKPYRTSDGKYRIKITINVKRIRIESGNNDRFEPDRRERDRRDAA